VLDILQLFVFKDGEILSGMPIKKSLMDNHSPLIFVKTEAWNSVGSLHCFGAKKKNLLKGQTEICADIMGTMQVSSLLDQQKISLQYFFSHSISILVSAKDLLG
jgi:hypothetical protein